MVAAATLSSRAICSCSDIRIVFKLGCAFVTASELCLDGAVAGKDTHFGMIEAAHQQVVNGRLHGADVMEDRTASVFVAL